MNSAFVWYEELCRSFGGSYPPKPNNTLLSPDNSSYHTQPHPIIVFYSDYESNNSFLFRLFRLVFYSDYFDCKVVMSETKITREFVWHLQWVKPSEVYPLGYINWKLNPFIRFNNGGIMHSFFTCPDRKSISACLVPERLYRCHFRSEHLNMNALFRHYWNALMVQFSNNLLINVL